MIKGISNLPADLMFPDILIAISYDPAYGLKGLIRLKALPYWKRLLYNQISKSVYESISLKYVLKEWIKWFLNSEEESIRQIPSRRY